MAVPARGCNIGEICEFEACHDTTGTQVGIRFVTHSNEKRLLRVIEDAHANPDEDLSLETRGYVAAVSRFQ